MILYREVKADKRVPTEGEYMTNEGWIEYDITHEVWGFISSVTAEWITVKNVVWWLEPIEITEEEITEMAYGYSRGANTSQLKNQLFQAFRTGSKAILSKLEGDEKR